MLAQWALIEQDLHEHYGIDAGDDALMAARSWRWLRVRILGLLDATPVYYPTSESVVVVHATRLARHFHQD